MRQFAERSGVSREAITSAERGEARADTYQRLEAFLDSWEHEVGEVQPIPDAPDVVTVELTIGGQAVKVTAPTSDPDALERAVAAIVRGLRGDDDAPV